MRREDIKHFLTIVELSKGCVNELHTAYLLPLLRVRHVLEIKALCQIPATFKSVKFLTVSSLYNRRSLATPVPNDPFFSLRVTLLTFNHDFREPLPSDYDPLHFKVSGGYRIKIYVFILRIHLTLILQLVFEDML